MIIKSLEQIGEKKWDEFVKNNSYDFGLLQSSNWRNFQISLGRKVFCLALVDGDEILATALIIKMPLMLNKSYFYIPRGPVIKSNHNNQTEINNFILNTIKLSAKSEKAIFLRFEPGDLTFFQDKSLINVGQVQPKKTFILNLENPEQELLAAMKSKTRYNIGLAKKHEIKISQGNDYFDDFWRLLEKTGKRQNIKQHSKNYYKKLLSLENTILYVAKYKNKAIAAVMIVNFGSWSVYLYGASDYNYRKYMAPFLLQWYAIRQAKINGKKYYDFWGVDETLWPGITKFKKGFDANKKTTKYLGAYDLVYSKLWYGLYKIFQLIF